MANTWFVQHGGKQYGPMAAAQLKKLAADGKITPATLVRMNAEGDWVAASNVRGLFVPAAGTAPPAVPPAQAAPPQSPAVPDQPAAQSAPAQARKVSPVRPPSTPPVARPAPAQPVAVKPITAQPVAPPVATVSSGNLPPAPWARQENGSAAHSAGGVAMGAKILGAVGIIFGAVAVATCWFALLGGPLGWTGIVVGALGLLIGIAGLVVAAMGSGSGLILNVAGASSSAVGLVVAVALGITFGLFRPEPTPQIVQRPSLPEVAPEPVKPDPPPMEVEPEPEPEPEWFDASQPITQGPITATIASVGIERVRLESTDLSTMRRRKPEPMLKIRVDLENTSNDKIVAAPGWVGGGNLIGQGVGHLLYQELGQAVQAATATAKLSDNSGNQFDQTPALSLFGAQIDLGADHALRPGKSTTAELVFPPPLESVEYLRLELPPAGFSGTDALRFQIPREMISGLSAPAGN
mgnify:FL=1